MKKKQPISTFIKTSTKKTFTLKCTLILNASILDKTVLFKMSAAIFPILSVSCTPLIYVYLANA